jgi:arylsulfatase A-like enzyme
MRVPFIAAWAKPNAANAMQKEWAIPAGAVQPQQAAVMDLFPTVLNLAGASVPKDYVVDGINLKSLLTGQRDKTRAETFLMHYPHAPHRSDYFTVLRDGTWKVVYHYYPSKASEDSHYQLFHLVKDPFEQSNLAKTEPEQLRTMMKSLVASLEHHKAVYPVDKDKKPLKPLMP